jgi:hypothetical protein
MEVILVESKSELLKDFALLKLALSGQISYKRELKLIFDCIKYSFIDILPDQSSHKSCYQI